MSHVCQPALLAVRLSIRRSNFTFFQRVRVVLALLLLPKCIVISAPAHQHATWVAVYPAVFGNAAPAKQSATFALSFVGLVLSHPSARLSPRLILIDRKIDKQTYMNTS